MRARVYSWLRGVGGGRRAGSPLPLPPMHARTSGSSRPFQSRTRCGLDRGDAACGQAAGRVAGMSRFCSIGWRRQRAPGGAASRRGARTRHRAALRAGANPMSDPPALRSSDEEREHAVGLLREASAEGRLTLDEFSQRVEAAYAARTANQLAELTSDLPVPAGRADPPTRRSKRFTISIFGGVRPQRTMAHRPGPLGRFDLRRIRPRLPPGLTRRSRGDGLRPGHIRRDRPLCPGRDRCGLRRRRHLRRRRPARPRRADALRSARSARPSLVVLRRDGSVACPRRRNRHAEGAAQGRADGRAGGAPEVVAVPSVLLRVFG